VSHRPDTTWTGDPLRDGEPRVPRQRRRVEFRPPSARDRQGEFETAGHSTAGASTERRPDAISLDYLTAHTLGPAANEDITSGLVARVWRARHEATPGGGRVLLARANADVGEEVTAYEAEVELFTYAGAEIVELDVAFDQAGAPIVITERPTGAGGAPELWLYWYDPFAADQVFSLVGPGRTPRCLLDDPGDLSQSDIVLVYINEDAGATGAVCYRQQRDRYLIEYVTPIVGGGTIAYPVAQTEWVGPITGDGIYGGVEVKLRVGRTAADVEASYPGEDVAGELITVPGPTFPPSGYKYGTMFGPTTLALSFSEPVAGVRATIHREGDAPWGNGKVAHAQAWYGIAHDPLALDAEPGAAAVLASESLTPDYNYPDEREQELTYLPGFLGFISSSYINWLQDTLFYPPWLPSFEGLYIRPVSRIGNPNPPLQLPAIDRMYVEDVMLSTSRRIVVTFSVRIASSYMLLQLATALYPIRAEAEPHAGTVELVAGEQRIAVYIVSPDVAVDPAASFFNDEELHAGTVALLSGILQLVGPIEIVPDPALATTPGGYNDEELHNATILLVGGQLAGTLITHSQINSPDNHLASMALQSGTLSVIVINHTTYDKDSQNATLALVSGSLAP
jgi:hypothetical protein